MKKGDFYISKTGNTLVEVTSITSSQPNCFIGKCLSANFEGTVGKQIFCTKYDYIEYVKEDFLHIEPIKIPINVGWHYLSKDENNIVVATKEVSEMSIYFTGKCAKSKVSRDKGKISEFWLKSDFILVNCKKSSPKACKKTVQIIKFKLIK